MELNFYFLVFSLFFPRIVLVVFLLLYPNLYPANDVPQWADLLLGIVLPRVLILIYIYEYMFVANLSQGLAASTVLLVTVAIIVVPWAYYEFGRRRTQ